MKKRCYGGVLLVLFFFVCICSKGQENSDFEKVVKAKMGDYSNEDAEALHSIIMQHFTELVAANLTMYNKNNEPQPCPPATEDIRRHLVCSFIQQAMEELVQIPKETTQEKNQNVNGAYDQWRGWCNEHYDEKTKQSGKYLTGKWGSWDKAYIDSQEHNRKTGHHAAPLRRRYF